jgi:hypothetical protein
MKNKLLVVTDLGLFKAYRCELTPQQTPRLATLEETVLEEGRRRFDEMVTDMAGRHTGPTQKSWGAPMTDDHNLRLETKRRLIKKIAAEIERLVEREDAETVWLAADPDINPRILEELAPAIRSRIEKNISLDLTKARANEVLDHFLDSADLPTQA